MNADKQQMRPIWYFVGLILVLIGGTVLLSGIYNLYFDLPNTTVLKGLHPNLWWGAVLMIIGILYLWLNKDAKIKS